MARRDKIPFACSCEPKPWYSDRVSGVLIELICKENGCKGGFEKELDGGYCTRTEDKVLLGKVTCIEIVVECKFWVGGKEEVWTIVVIDDFWIVNVEDDSTIAVEVDFWIVITELVSLTVVAVSYTHLDVYKRQIIYIYIYLYISITLHQRRKNIRLITLTAAFYVPYNINSAPCYYYLNKNLI